MPSEPGEDRPEAPRPKILPRSALGITVVILALAVGAAFSGTVLYAYYSYRQTQAESAVSGYVNGFDKRYQTALATIKADAANGTTAIQAALAPLLKVKAQGGALAGILQHAAPALWFVHTTDSNGQPAAGSAFAVASDSHQTLLVASYSTIAAATHQPGPAVFVRKRGQDTQVTLWSWDQGRDLALLIMNKGNQPTLGFAPSGSAPRIGDQVYALSGLGGSGGAITAGQIADVSSDTIQTDAAIGVSFQGGPLVNSQGQVVAVDSRNYAPLGFSSTGVYFTVPVGDVCQKILRCPGGTTPASPGNRGG
ncbi:MAG: trypsin-like peptidase domain-containing protein [Acidimicrobiales bacterium]